MRAPPAGLRGAGGEQPTTAHSQLFGIAAVQNLCFVVGCLGSVGGLLAAVLFSRRIRRPDVAGRAKQATLLRPRLRSPAAFARTRRLHAPRPTRLPRPTAATVERMCEVRVLDPGSAGSTVVGLDLSLTGTGVAAIAVDTAELVTAVHRSPPPAANTIAAHAARHRQLADGIVAQVVAADPALVVIEGLQFSVKMRDSSLTRRGFLWWAVVEGLTNAGAPIIEVTPQQIKQFATGKGNASKSEVVAAYARAWPAAATGSNIEDRADAANAAALGAAWLGVQGLPHTITAVRKKLLGKLPEPTVPVRALRRELGESA